MKELSLAHSWYWFLLIAIACYLIGCFNFAVIIARAHHRNVRNIGSGNPGTMNISREFGLKVGGLNFLLDALKGGIPALVGYLVFRNYVFEGTQILVSDFSRYYFGLFVILGHIYPVTMRFKGGKGIAATLGLFLFALTCEQLYYLPIVCGGYLFILGYIAFTELGSMGSLLGVTGFSIWQIAEFYVRYASVLHSGYVISTFLMIFAVNVLTWFAHRKNLFRLFIGEEHRTSVIKLAKGRRGKDNM